MSAVVDEGIDGFLKHSRLIAHDDIRGVQLLHACKAVIAVDDSAVEVIEVRGCISAAVEHDHRADVRRNDGQRLHDHPLRTVAGLTECFENLQTLQQLAALLGFLRGGTDFRCAGFLGLLADFLFELFAGKFEVILPHDVGILSIGAEGGVCKALVSGIKLSLADELVTEAVIAVLRILLKQVQNRLCAGFRLEIAVILGGILLLGQGLELVVAGQILTLMRRIRLTRIGDDIFREVDNAFEILLGDVAQHLTDAGGRTLEVPDMCDRCSQLNVAHTLTAHLCAGNLNAAVRADLALETHLLELAAVAFPVLGRSEDLFAEQTAFFRLLGAVVDGFGALDLSVAPLADLLGRGETDLNGIKGSEFQRIPSYGQCTGAAFMPRPAHGSGFLTHQLKISAEAPRDYISPSS